MKYLHKKVIKIPIYKGKLIIILTNSKKRLRKYLPQFDDAEIYAHAINSDFNGSDGYFVVLNLNHHFAKINKGTIAHEAFHIANYIAEGRGIELDFNNPEPIAYLTEWVTNNIHKFIRKHKKIAK